MLADAIKYFESGDSDLSFTSVYDENLKDIFLLQQCLAGFNDPVLSAAVLEELCPSSEESLFKSRMYILKFSSDEDELVLVRQVRNLGPLIIKDAFINHEGWGNKSQRESLINELIPTIDLGERFVFHLSPRTKAQIWEKLMSKFE